MLLIATHLRREYDFYRENGVRVRHSGDIAGLPREVRAEIDSAMRDTESFDRMTVVLAINYGGRDEIVRGVNRWLASGGGSPLTERELRNHLDLPDVPDPDLIIRTAGEMRLSNFLIWQGAYAEYHSSPRLWPDFRPEDLETAIRDYAGRNRKFGGQP